MRTNKFYDSLDARLVLDRAGGKVFAAVCALLVGFSVRETAAKLGVPATTLARRLRALAGKEAAA